MDEQIIEIADRIVKFCQDNGCRYADVRAEEYHLVSISIEDGQIENISSDSDGGIGIRLMAGNAWSFCSISNSMPFDIIKQNIQNAIKSAKYYSKYKKSQIYLWDGPLVNAKRDFPVKTKPTKEDLINIGLECDKKINEKEMISKSIVTPWFSKTSKYFSNSEGTSIIQNYTDTVIEMTATAHMSGMTQSVNITEGGRGGIEQIKGDISINSADEISNKAVKLLDAKPIKEQRAKVVMNPDFVALLTHEILGHPSEADRVLGREMAWAGGAWWNRKIEQKIGSDVLTVFDDPTIPYSLGWYDYDDEGVRTDRTILVENGILKNHMQSRETAQIFDTNPTGNMRATNYRFMPLIRMACTCIAAGDWKKDEMIKEIKEGYLISNMKIPSIDMKRYNWSISCQYAQKIEDGELTGMQRDVIVMGTAPEFFNSIDACGDDFTVRPITNCGKGDPMQSMVMGNGGPSIRGTATVKSVI